MKLEVPHIPYLDALRAELLAGIAHKRRRRTVRRRAAVVIGAVAVAIPLGLAGPLDAPESGPTTVRVSNALAITTDDGWIELRIVDPAADAGRMTAELQAAGIDGRVCTVLAPTSTAVGAWLAIAETFTAGGVGVAGDLKFFPKQALSSDELRRPPRVGERVPAIQTEIVSATLGPDDAPAAKVEPDAATGTISIRGTGRLREVRRQAPDLIRIRSDFSGRPQPGILRLFLGRAPRPDERVPEGIHGSTDCS